MHERLFRNDFFVQCCDECFDMNAIKYSRYEHSLILKGIFQLKILFLFLFVSLRLTQLAIELYMNTWILVGLNNLKIFFILFVADSTKKTGAAVADETKYAVDSSKHVLDNGVEKTKNSASDIYQSGRQNVGTGFDKAWGGTKSAVDTGRDALARGVEDTTDSASDAYHSGAETIVTGFGESDEYVANKVKECAGTATDETVKTLDDAEDSAEKFAESKNDTEANFLEIIWDSTKHATLEAAKSVEEFVEDGVDSTKHMMASAWETTKHGVGWDDAKNQENFAGKEFGHFFYEKVVNTKCLISVERARQLAK